MTKSSLKDKMKKIILLGIILSILLFSYPTKSKHKNNNNRTNKKNTILVTVQNSRKFDSKEEVFKNYNQNPIDISQNKNTIQLSSRHNKGKIMFSKDNNMIPETKFE